MRLTRGVLAVAATALTPALLLTGPAFAADSVPAPVAATAAAGTDDPGTPVDEMSEHELRAAILTILGKPYAGKRVTRDANAALDGTLEDMRTFLKTGYRLAQYEDDKVALFTILGKPYAGKRVKQEIYALLDAPTPEKLRTWLETGYRLAQAEDDRVAVARMLADPDISDALRAAAEEVIDGTPEELRYFLETGQYEVDE
ncbi:ALF repeat-containing protein [Streptomyces sp. NPDC057239]|uniref:ALF repeat-containing protein n=1 Tax=Streptomyces sp. NPDC057239 TaxID=3346061 RepID=UPI00363A6293